ncbi:hypothetical protein B0A48_03787 [Cryoendolithus antarcticus]|uniref:GDS1 winged helix domain-containing protein n=1 Tax=Cryoendolithus antarcticus TaxID=1507870 RepID=A0A1V8TGJ3_9PEZI|nr:hypothetical protein B0A48_03787 [Cryoendolithus antarcticus]
MPYNTRRKSLSLSELGITLPKRSRTASHPSPPSTIVEGDEPPVKKSKRSHGAASPTAGAMSPPRTTCVRFKEESMPKRALALSPPPSPGREGDNKIDTEGISDDIVVGALRQLEKTGNRPHLVKELAAVLATNVPAVERSANPSALISSRLTAYLHRSWPAISPCPLAKDLSPVYPRRLYFYLTTTPHQPIPDHPPAIIAKPAARIISPSLSSASAADEDEDANESYIRARTALSPSPEVDLSSPELDTDGPPTHTRSFSASGSVPREHPPTTTNLSHNRRAVSPQLEHEERDFKQTANLLHEAARLRRKSEEDVKMEIEADAVAGAEREEESAVVFSVEMDGEEAEQSAAEAALELFEHAECLKVEAVGMEFSSPVIRAQEESVEVSKSMSPVKKESEDVQMDEAKLSIDTMGETTFDLGDAALEWESLQSPENIGVAELEGMFDDY